MKNKILITVRGGIVQAVASTDKDLEIVIVDHDKTEAGESPVSEILNPDYYVMQEKRGEKFYEQFSKHKTEIGIREELKRMDF